MPMTDKEKSENLKASQKKYLEKNRAKINEYMKLRRQNLRNISPEFREAESKASKRWRDKQKEMEKEKE